MGQLNLCARAHVKERYPELIDAVAVILRRAGLDDDALLWRLDWTEDNGIGLILERWDGNGPRSYWTLATPFYAENLCAGPAEIIAEAARYLRERALSGELGFHERVRMTLATPAQKAG